jgi:hypothetical protein
MAGILLGGVTSIIGFPFICTSFSLKDYNNLQTILFQMLQIHIFSG